MATLRALALTEIVSPEDLVKWLCRETVDESVKEKLDPYSSLKHDFVPEFLNKLREDTVPILENGVAQSPVKTPQSMVPAKQHRPRDRPGDGNRKARRSNLFSPAGKPNSRGDNRGRPTPKDSLEQDTASDSTSKPKSASDNASFSTVDNSPELHRSLLTQCADSSVRELDSSEVHNSHSRHFSHDPENVKQQSAALLSYPSSMDDSVVAGSSDSSFYSCNHGNGSELRPRDSTYADSVSGSSLSSASHHDSNSYHPRHHSGNDSRGGAKNPKHFLSPNAHSTPDRRRSSGRPTPSQALHLGDFLQGRRHDSTTDTSSDFSAVQGAPAGNCKGSKKKKKKQRSWLQNDASESSQSYSVASFDDFPPVSPVAVADLRKPSSIMSQNTLVSPIYNEIRARVGIPNSSSAGQASRRPGATGNSIAALDFTSDRNTAVAQTEMVNVVAEQQGDDSPGDTVHAWGKKAGPALNNSSPQDFPAFHNNGGNTDSEKENIDTAVSHEKQSAGNSYSKNEQKTLDNVINTRLDTAPLPSGKRDSTGPSSNLTIRKLSLNSVHKLEADLVFSPKPVDTVWNTTTSVWATTTTTRVSSGVELSSLPHGYMNGGRNHEEQESSANATSMSNAEVPERTVSPIKRIRLPDCGDQFKTPSKGGTAWPLSAGNLMSPCTPEKPALDGSMSVIKLVKASLLEVTHKPVLHLFVRLYSACIDAHLFPNLSMELYFLAQLLIAQTSEDDLPLEQENLADDIEDRNFFQTVHNVVYFAVCVLEKQTELLKRLDRSTLRLLSENERVRDFCPQLHQQIKVAFDNVEDHSNSSIHNNSMVETSFQSVLWNRRNFPDDKSFHLFKKQRDTFFFIKKEWEQKRGLAGWSLGTACDERIRTMFQVNELATHLCFAQLFVSQLIMSCKNQELISTKSDYKDISQLISLKTANPDKFQKLQERLMKPASCGGPCPTATFPGHQQFFHDFILCADSPHFYHHVADILLSRIQELNQMDFDNQAPRATNSEVADKDPQLSHEEQEEECAAFSAALLTMRLLARFLGLLHYLPYQGVDRLPKHLQQDNIALRNKLAPAWDLCPSVERAAEKGVLALTVPWVVDYLAMMDTVAPRSTHVRYLLMLLRHLLRSVWAELKRSGFTYSRLLVVTSLGWLFDQPCMPVGYFFAELPSLEEEEKSVAVSLAPEAKECKDLVTQDLFYSCCPYFGEMRYLLTEFSLGSRAKTEVRKVNPLPPRPSSAPAARTTLVSRDPNTKYTQSKLLGNFFHMYSKSIHRLVELVSEQNSSNFIKDLRYHALPSALARCEGEGGAMSHVPETAQQIYTQTLDKMMADLESVCMDKVKGSLQLLLPPNNHDTVGAFAVQMCCALTTQKVTRWIKTHVEFDAFHNKLTAGASHKSKLSTPRRDGPHTKQPVKKEQKGSAEKADTTTHTSAVACTGALQLTAEKPAGKEANQSETCHKLAKRMTLEDRLCNSLSVPLRKGETDGADTSAEAVTGFGALSSRSGDSNFVRVASVIGKSGDGSPLLPNKPVATSLGDSKSYTEVTLPGNLPVTEGKLSSSTSCKTIVASPDAKISLKSVSSPLCTLASCQADCKTCSPSSAYCKSCITSTSSCNSGMTSAADIKSSGTTADTACQLVSSTDSTRSVMTSADKSIVTSSVDVRSLTSSEVCPRRTTRRRSEVCNPVTSEVDCKLVTTCGVILAEGEQTAAPSSAVDDRTSDISDSKKPAGVESGNELTNPADTGKTHDSCDTVSDKCEMVDSDMICYLLRDTQDLLWSLRVEGEGVSQEELHTLLHKAVRALSSSEEQPPQTPPFLVGSITQLSAAVVFCQPPLWTEATSSLFVDVWTRAGDMCKELHVLCTSVFLGYLEEAEDLELSLQLYSKLLVTLIERQLLTLSGIEQAFASALPEFEEYTQQIQDITQHITDHLHNTE